MKRKVIYSVIVILTIACGIFVRKQKAFFPDWINLWLGDSLYAFMMYFIVAAVISRKPAWIKAATALVICCCIELSQLYQADWIVAARQTLPGRLVLGQGFLWSDLVAYFFGIAAAFCVDILWLQRNKTTA